MTRVKRLLFAAAIASSFCAPQALGAADVMYKSPNFGWSIKFPGDWRLNDADPAAVVLTSPDGSGMCGIKFQPVRFESVQMFADFMLNFQAQALQQQNHLQSVTRSRKQSVLSSGQESVDALVDIQPGGRSHRLFVLGLAVPGGRLGYALDCETTERNWNNLEKAYDAIMASFAVADPNASAAAPH